jgi:hypothetical protein
MVVSANDAVDAQAIKKREGRLRHAGMPNKRNARWRDMN